MAIAWTTVMQQELMNSTWFAMMDTYAFYRGSQHQTAAHRQANGFAAQPSVTRVFAKLNMHAELQAA
jgi:hypothetical protein